MVLHRDLSLMRIIAQGLVPKTKFKTAVESINHLLAMQAQQPSAYPHAIKARTYESQRDIDKAFLSEKLIRSRPMRGTLHLTTAKDYHLMRILNTASTYSLRNERELGIDDQLFKKTIDITLEYLDTKKEASKEELKKLWQENNLLHKTRPNRSVNFLLYRLDREGYMAMKPSRKNKPRFISVHNLPKPEKAIEDSYIEIAYRYIYSHGPVSLIDFARWSGLNLTKSREIMIATWEKNRESIIMARALPDEKLNLQEIAAKDWDKNSLFYRRDLPKLLYENKDDAMKLYYLPPFDEIHNGYHDRTCLCDEAGEYLICPARNGSNRGIFIKGGRLIGVYAKNTGIELLENCTKKTETKLKEIIAKL